MQKSLWVASLALAVSVAAAHAASPMTGADAKAAASGQVATSFVYIVQLEDPSLAAHDGATPVHDKSGKALAATAPGATGARKLDPASANSKAYVAHLAAKQSDVLADAAAILGRKLVPAFRYRYALNGFAVRLSPDEAIALRAVAGVKSVEVERIEHGRSDAGPQFIGAEAVWNGTVVGSNVRTKGEGAVVGVIDSGINPTHPSFADLGGDGHNHANPRGRFYGQCVAQPARCNDKLIGIYDFTQEGNRDGTDIDGHGSHVAGTAAGNQVESAINANTGALALRVSGVAPHANLISYKACTKGTESTTCAGSATLAAIDQAVADGIDVINYSLGSSATDPWAAVRTGGRDQDSALLNARFAGTLAVVSAGNDGPIAGTVESPANAPWVITAANITHDRAFVNAVEAVTGTGIAAPKRYVGTSVNGKAVTARIVDAADYGFPLCSKGEDIDSNPTGASNPFAPNTFNGEIVLCRRGITARVAKGFNVRASGAGGMILYNSPAEAESIVADDHYLPATHIGNAAGQELAALLASAKAQGGQVTGTITATAVTRTGSTGTLASSSGRGPVTPVGSFMKPNIAAPGTSILAADFDSNGLAVLSGTSMAAPHIAGAIALLASAHPDWSVADLESALLGTARDDVKSDDGVSATKVHDVGAGRANVADAVRAGLSFPITREQYVAADPAGFGGGAGSRDPAALNTPSIADNCAVRCSYVRSVKALVTGSWNLSARSMPGVNVKVTPATLSMQKGDVQTVTIDVDVLGAPAVGQWNFGRVEFVPQNPNVAAVTSMPVAILGDNGSITDVSLQVNRTSGFQDDTIAGLPVLANARFLTSTLERPAARSVALAQDATNENPYDAGSNLELVAIDATQEFAGVIAETASTARDVDLYVGIDRDGDGAAEASELLCEAKGAASNERCVVTVPSTAGARFWVVTHVFQSATPGSTDSVGIETTRVSLSATNPLDLAATLPGRTAATTPVRFAWSKPNAIVGERYEGILSLRQGTQAIVDVPVSLTSSVQSVDPLVLVPDGSRFKLAVAPNAAHDRLIVNVPANATGMTIESSGTGDVDLYVARAPNDANPIPAAPARGEAQGTSIHPGAVESLTLNAPVLTPGRWYVTPVNPGGVPADIELRATLTTNGDAPVLADNGYFNPARSGHGVFLHQIAALRAMVWYTYLQDGTPAWYLASAPAPAANNGVWTASLLRFTWDGTAGVSTPVGQVVITARGEDRFDYAFRIDGAYGAESLQPTGTITCPTGNSIAGSWYAPSAPGYGFNIVTAPSFEAMTTYVYDSAGNPRWVLGATTTPGQGAIATSEYRGFCPTCAFAAPTSAVVGNVTRSYASATNGNAAVGLPPLSWSTNAAIEKLTATQVCR